MDSFYTTCNQIDTDLGLNLYHDHHDYLVMQGVEGFEQTTFPVLLDDSPRAHNVKNQYQVLQHEFQHIANSFDCRLEFMCYNPHELKVVFMFQEEKLVIKVSV